MLLLLNIIYRVQESIYWEISKPQGTNQVDNVSNCVAITPVISHPPPPQIPTPLSMKVTIKPE
jgi:hypothetical protein